MPVLAKVLCAFISSWNLAVSSFSDVIAIVTNSKQMSRSIGMCINCFNLLRINEPRIRAGIHPILQGVILLP
jgi:hypothetical protein